ncbi:hypothetical protein, partial [Kiloniella sp. b19]|uniref:hypothetical protein n=1 Tax=Kiloniella sp. GXU_MW_B19 TaxID=3141326 RepID=UPI0031D66882
ADYQEALRNLVYRSNSDNPDNYGKDTLRTMTAEVTDGEGNSNTVTSDVGVEGVNQAAVLERPYLTAVLYGAKVTEASSGGASTVDEALANNPAFDPGRPLSGDGLGGTGALGVHTLTKITGKIWLEAGQTYEFREFGGDLSRLTIGGQTILDKTRDWEVPQDSFTPSESGFYDFNFLLLNSNNRNVDYRLQYRPQGQSDWLPIQTRGTVVDHFTEGGEAVPVLPDVILADVDGENMESATVRITEGFLRGSDELVLADGYTLPAGMSWKYDPETGIGTLSGSGSVADYQEAMRNIQYRNNSANPDNYGDDPERTIVTQVNDGSGNSESVSTIIGIVAINQPPVLTLDGDDVDPETRSAEPALQLSDLLDQEAGEDEQLLDDFLQSEQKRVETMTEPAAPQDAERGGADFGFVTLENSDQDEQSLINQNL